MSLFGGGLFGNRGLWGGGLMNNTTTPGPIMPTPGGQLQRMQPQPMTSDPLQTQYPDIDAQRAQIQQMLAEAQSAGINPWPSIFQSIAGVVQMGAGIAALSAGRQRGPGYTISGIAQIGEGIGSLAGTMATREQQQAQKQDRIGSLVNAQIGLGNLEQSRRQAAQSAKSDAISQSLRKISESQDLSAKNPKVASALGSQGLGELGVPVEGDLYKQDYTKERDEILTYYIPTMAQGISLGADRKQVLNDLVVGVTEAYPNLPEEEKASLFATAKFIADATPRNLEWQKMVQEGRGMSTAMLNDEYIVMAKLAALHQQNPQATTEQIIELGRRTDPQFDVAFQKYAGLFTNGNTDTGGKAIAAATDFFMNSPLGLGASAKIAQAKTPEELKAAQEEATIGIRNLLPVFSIHETLKAEAAANAEFQAKMQADLQAVMAANPGMDEDTAFRKMVDGNPVYQALFPSAPGAASLIPKEPPPPPAASTQGAAAVGEYFAKGNAKTAENRARLGKTLATVAQPVAEVGAAAKEIMAPNPNTLLGRANEAEKRRKKQEALVMDEIVVQQPHPPVYGLKELVTPKKKKR